MELINACSLSNHMVFSDLCVNTTKYIMEIRSMSWSSECPDVKNYKWRLNPVWDRMLSCTHMAAVGIEGFCIVLLKLYYICCVYGTDWHSALRWRWSTALHVDWRRCPPRWGRRLGLLIVRVLSESVTDRHRSPTACQVVAVATSKSASHQLGSTVHRRASHPAARRHLPVNRSFIAAAWEITFIIHH